MPKYRTETIEVDERELGTILAALRMMVDRPQPLSPAANRLATLDGGVFSGDPAKYDFGYMSGAEIEALIDRLFVWEVV